MWSYKNLDVYARALDLADVVNKITLRFPDHEKYELGRQMRRAVTSISMNISEGSLKRTSKDFVSFLHIALGSCGEVETQVEIAGRFGYLIGGEKVVILRELDKVKRMIYGLIKWVLGKDVK